MVCGQRSRRGSILGTGVTRWPLVKQVKKHGGRVALFGRRIKVAADPVIFTELLRAVADDALTPEAATRGYHGRLAAAGVTPSHSLDDDLVITTPELL